MVDEKPKEADNERIKEPNEKSNNGLEDDDVDVEEAVADTENLLGDDVFSGGGAGTDTNTGSWPIVSLGVGGNASTDSVSFKSCSSSPLGVKHKSLISQMSLTSSLMIGC